MISEITIKINLVPGTEGATTGTSAITMGGGEILPPEAQREGMGGEIPPPPTPEEAFGGMGEEIPPPPPRAEDVPGGMGEVIPPAITDESEGSVIGPPSPRVPPPNKGNVPSKAGKR